MPALPKIHDNTFVQKRLEKYNSSYEASLALPFLDDVLHGAARLDLGGNTRPLSKGLLYTLLATLPEISRVAVQEGIRCSVHAQITGRINISDSHAKKVATSLRIASTIIERELKRAHVHTLSSMCFGSDPLWEVDPLT